MKRRASRSLPAVSSRFCRVTLYSIDLIVLALLQSDDLGPYAASRRLTFAMLALALVVPSALAGPLAHAFARGTGNARKLVEKATGRILVLTLPPTFGLLLTADGWIPILLGRNFDGAGDWVRVLILRLPVLALSSLFHAAIVASGRDRQVARQGGGLLAIALPAYLLGWHLGGGWGVASAVLAVEILGLIWGYRTADGIGMAPGPGSVPAPLLCGLVAMVAICGLIHPPVVYLQSLWGGIGFGLGWGLASFATTYLRAPSPGRRRPHQSAGAEEDKFRAWHTPVAPRPKRPEPVTLADIEERVA